MALAGRRLHRHGAGPFRLPSLMRLLCLTLLLCSASAIAEIRIDGVLDEPEWQQAQRFDQFVAVQPLSGEPAPADRRAEALMLSTPEGLLFAVRAWHPPDVPQTRTRIPRDGRAAVDRFNVMIDFDADGRQGYDFTITTAGDIIDEVIRSENQFNSDWDGAWEHAVADVDGGTVAEWRIPWSIAPMRNSGAPRRTIAVYFDRVIAASNQRFAFPDASFMRPRFLSDFHRVEVDQYRQTQLAITPYGVLRRDQISGESDTEQGFDLFWKPSGDHQFALTVNPDFGQVESDALVVNFSAIETFFTDRRPFFTENQGYFDLGHPLGTLFYTRRVGGPLDDGSGAASIDAAVKANGSVGRFGYGLFAADEDGDAGRQSRLLRSTYDVDSLRLGLTHSRVERPFLERVAEVSSLDAVWQPGPRWRIRPLLSESRSETAGVEVRGRGAGLVADWDPDGPWRQEYIALYADDQLQLNDLGFQERNDFRYLEWETEYRQDALPEHSAWRSHAWEFELAYRENTAGERLRAAPTLQRRSSRRRGGDLFWLLRWQAPAVDDRLSRGNGSVPLQGGWQFYVEGDRPRRGDGRMAWFWNLEVFPNAVGGHSVYGGVQPRWHVGDRFDIDLGLYGVRRPDWLLWQQGREFASFHARQIELYSNLNWFPTERQELRIKLQAIAIDAELKQARRLQGEQLVDSDAPVADFSLRNFGVQVRWRYKLGTLSDIYAVYGRGGFAFDELQAGEERSVSGILSDSLSLRDEDQLLLKIAYRFSL